MEEVAAGRFREDLLYRLNVITIQIPSLSERKDDIILLATEILKKKAGQRPPKILHPDATTSLLEYRWPGNVRELENVLERAIILANGETIMPKDLVLPAHFIPVSASPDQGDGMVGSAISLKELEREHISRVLTNTKWNKKSRLKNTRHLIEDTLHQDTRVSTYGGITGEQHISRFIKESLPAILFISEHGTP